MWGARVEGDAMGTNTIGDQLDMDFEEVADEVPFDVDEGFEYDEWTRFDRDVTFDILWDETGTYPPEIEDPVVDALTDDNEHVYRITYDSGTVRETKGTAFGLFAYLDDEATVEVDADNGGDDGDE